MSLFCIPNTLNYTVIPHFLRELGSKTPCEKRKFGNNWNLPRQKKKFNIFKRFSFFQNRLWLAASSFFYFISLNIMLYAAKSSPICRKILMLLSINGSGWCIFILWAKPKICETEKYEPPGKWGTTIFHFLTIYFYANILTAISIEIKFIRKSLARSSKQHSSQRVCNSWKICCKTEVWICLNLCMFLFWLCGKHIRDIREST
jgi:hypothetical protein